ncbi:HNH endonuclease [Streptomyces sp. GQFP]|uniref:HNH endonuclease n=1 Tax=Streptomyces sp. GQFP TaxID=2907545 RepID=UPI001F32055C|nr:HNH endonuclease [Streptomyces sp. GQFP]UIX33567.1 HNH endonuclease [Streptomyces sp. GQFP]
MAAIARTVPTPAERFTAKTKPGPWSLRRDCPGPCRLWDGAINEDGYGHFWLAGRTVKAHRAAVALADGTPVPAHLDVDHRCRRRACVSRAHLEPVTHRENVLRSSNHVAARAAVTHCPARHAYDAANTIRAKNGTRKCRACKNAAARARRAEAREQQTAPVITLPTHRIPERTAA